jgi:HEAT repeat protein
LAAALGVAACGPAAFERLEDKDRLVRMAAADMLRRMRYAPALPAIARRMLAHPDDFLTAASTLRNWGEKAGVEAFRTHLSSDDPQIRAAACLAILQYGGKALIADLLALAQHDEPLVASAALRALEELDGTQFALAQAAVEGRSDAVEIRRARLRWVTYKRR